MTSIAPIIVTAELDQASHLVLDELRQRHFPAERNHLAAHLTMYHCLPGDALDAVAERALSLAGAQGPLAARLAGLRSLGRGVAVVVEADGLQWLRNALGAPFRPRLTAQDRQPWRPHVTIANKLTQPAAAALLDALQASWRPRAARVEGITLWRYLGPQWGWQVTVSLAGTSPAAAGSAGPG